MKRRAHHVLSTLAFVSGLALSATLTGAAGEFRLRIGPPTAATAPNMSKKIGAVLAVRVEGCPEPAKARLAGTAEGLVKGVRRSVALEFNALPTAGAYWLEQTWPHEGVWVVHVIGTYQDVRASAIVPIGPRGFLREPSKFYPRLATAAEIETALKALSKGSSE